MVELLRERAGAHVVTLRGYQAWEAGGGIKWENVKVLAEVLGQSPEWLMNGDETDTPDLLGGPLAGETTQLDRIQADLAEIKQALHDAFTGRTEQGADILTRLTSLEAALTSRISESDERLTEAVAQVGRDLRAE